MEPVPGAAGGSSAWSRFGRLIPAGSVGRAEPELRMMMQRCSCGISGPARSGKYQKSHEAFCEISSSFANAPEAWIHL